jgi:hypothetical protein
MGTHTERNISAIVRYALLVIAILFCSRDAKAGPQSTIWGSGAVPTVVDNGPDSPVELGVKFTSSSDGTIAAIRFYKSSANTGTHVGNVWSSTGALLATATFTNETASGWQQVSLSAPVAITANTIYVVSYHAIEGHFSADQGFFAESGVTNSPLLAPENGVNGGNGVYMYGSNSSFPSNTYRSTNYWVDVVFTAGIASPPSCPCTIWSSSAVPTVVDNGPDSPVELGVKFTSDLNGTITGLRFYRSSANTGTHIGNLWSSTGVLLTTATFTNETASGWQQVSFSPPVSITANTVYVASYYTSHSHFSVDLNAFTSAGVDNPPLHALENGVNGGNGVYMYGTNSSFPGKTYNAANYWVDVVFSPTPTGVGTAPIITTQPISETVDAGQSATFTVANTGTAPMAYRWQKNGVVIAGATVSSYSTAVTGTSDNGSQFSVVVSNGLGSVTSVSAILTVEPGTLILNASSGSVNFGSVDVSGSSVQSVMFTNAGTANVTISNVSASGAGFNASGLSSGMILAPGQPAALNVTFAPAAAGNASGSITVSSNASSGARIVTLVGTGSAASVTQSVSLSWSGSTSTVTGYNVYVSTISGSGYAKLTTSPVLTTAFVDSGLDTAQTRYYVVTSVNSSNEESAYSNEVAAVIP